MQIKAFGYWSPFYWGVMIMAYGPMMLIFWGSEAMGAVKGLNKQKYSFHLLES